MTDIDTTDPLLELLTDALQAGPGSPAWHRAVTELRARGGAEADEYRLLITARERLESGKGYRSVRAGPGFTRRLMTAIDREAAAPAGTARSPVTSLLIAAASVTMVGVVIAVAILLLRGAGDSADRLAARQFGNTTIAHSFDSPQLPPQWRTTGPRAVDVANGLRLAAGLARDATTAPRTLTPTTDIAMGTGVGGVELTDPLPLSRQPFAVEAVVSPRAGGAVEVYVTYGADGPAVTAQTLSCRVAADRATVTPPSGMPIDPVGWKTAPDRHVVRIAVQDRSAAAVTLDGRVIYAADPRVSMTHAQATVGVRLVATDQAADPGVVHSVRILKP